MKTTEVKMANVGLLNLNFNDPSEIAEVRCLGAIWLK